MTFSWNFCLKLHFSRYKHPTIRRIFGSVDENVVTKSAHPLIIVQTKNVLIIAVET